MRIGIVDLGTNSVRFALYEENLGQIHCLYKKKLMLRPGQGVYQTGRLKKSVVRRLVSAFTKYRHLADQFAVETIYAAATAALREAENANKVIRRIMSQSGIKIQIISGEKEAQLIAQGILHFDAPKSNPFCLIDIGGGSTEISLFDKKKFRPFPYKKPSQIRPKQQLSLPLGAFRLQQMFLPHPQSPHLSHRLAHLSQMRHWIGLELEKSLGRFSKNALTLGVGSSGTIRALARILDPKFVRQTLPLNATGKKNKVQTKLCFTQNDLQQLIEEMLFMTKTELLRLPGMELRRTETIFSGAVLLFEILNFLNIKRVQTTHCGLRDGLLLQALHEAKP